ncbi:MAG: hypothetical protein AAGE84_17150 [Cyanobacteria bacterium P01_G01_bin.39]
MKPHQAEVVNCVVANTRYGKKLVLNCKLLPSKEKVACWSNELDNPVYRSKKPGDVIELIESDKNKFSVLDREPATPKQTATQAVDDYLSNDLGLPELLTDKQKQDLSKLTQERAKLLVFCIETMKNEMDAKGFEFYENSCRSLGVSLFIHISRHLD